MLHHLGLLDMVRARGDRGWGSAEDLTEGAEPSTLAKHVPTLRKVAAAAGKVLQILNSDTET